MSVIFEFRVIINQFHASTIELCYYEQLIKSKKVLDSHMLLKANRNGKGKLHILESCLTEALTEKEIC